MNNININKKKRTVLAIHKICTVSFFMSCACFLCTFIFGCSFPLEFPRTEKILIELPAWDNTSYPVLENWKIEITDSKVNRIFYINSNEKIFSCTVTKDSITSILAYPVTEPDFFYPAGTIYPSADNGHSTYINQTKTYRAQWHKGITSITLKELLLMRSDKTTNALKYFNFNKLDETFLSKDKSAFEKYDSLSTKKCTTAFNTDIETLKQRIINPPSRFTVPYFNTKSYSLSSLKNHDSSAHVFCPYIPLNEFSKEKGCITIQTEPPNCKTAFLYKGQLHYFNNKELIPY